MALLIIPFAIGGVGAGDVKLLGIVGALKGSTFAVYTFLGMAIWGGIIAIIYLARRRQIKATVCRLKQYLCLMPLGIEYSISNLNRQEISIYYPYGVAIGLGVITAYLGGWCF